MFIVVYACVSAIFFKIRLLNASRTVDILDEIKNQAIAIKYETCVINECLKQNQPQINTKSLRSISSFYMHFQLLMFTAKASVPILLDAFQLKSTNLSIFVTPYRSMISIFRWYFELISVVTE